MNIVQFPPRNDPFEKDIPVWMSFYCANYSTFSRNRTRDHVINSAYNNILIPYPQEHNTLNSQNYEAGGSLNKRVIETGNLGQMASAQFDAFFETANSMFTGGGVVRFDHFESILKPGARRTHTFNILMIAKNAAQAEAANNIGLNFQTNVFPIVSSGSILTMIHPPLWCFKAIVIGSNNDFLTKSYWDGQPLVSVLQKVDINRSPILNAPFVTSDFKPLAVNIKLGFIELEPALQDGSGNLNIISRSERLNNS